MNSIPEISFLDDAFLLILWLVAIYVMMALAAGLVWLGEKLLRGFRSGRNRDRRLRL